MPAAATRAATPTSASGCAPTRRTHWLAAFLDVATASSSCCPRPPTLKVERYELPNLRALNFVVEGLLGEGVASSTRQDPQAKGLGEWLRVAPGRASPTALLENRRPKDLMSTDVWTTPERVALRKLVRDFTEREIVPHLDAVGARRRGAAQSLHKAAAAAGLLGVAFPEEAGGQGGDDRSTTRPSPRRCSTPARRAACCPRCSPTASRCPHIVQSGNADLIDRYAKPTLAGEMIGSLAVTEPDAGSDVAAIRTRAVRDGDHYVVNGAKTFITSSTRADFVTTVVRTGDDPHHGISLLVVDTDSPGFSVVRRLEKMGWLCSDTGELAYVDVRVPAANLIGAEGSGFIQVAQQFAGERLGLAVHGYGVAQRALDLTVAYIRSSGSRSASR